MMNHCSTQQQQLCRLDEKKRKPIQITFNSKPLPAMEGDTVLTALLLNRKYVRQFEFGAERRAGFCMMGACQDCWVRTKEDIPVRACTTLVEAGMALTAGGHNND